MPFICTLLPSGNRSEIFRSGDEATVLARVGYDESSGKTYSIMAGFSPVSPGDLEFVFALIEAGVEEDTARAIFDARVVATLIPNEEDRKKIMAEVLSATRLLLETIKPDRFVMATRDGYLPAKAMEKYCRLNRLFRELGFVVVEADPYNGMRAWWMEREG